MSSYLFLSNGYLNAEPSFQRAYSGGAIQIRSRSPLFILSMRNLSREARFIAERTSFILPTQENFSRYVVFSDSSKIFSKSEERSAISDWQLMCRLSRPLTWRPKAEDLGVPLIDRKTS